MVKKSSGSHPMLSIVIPTRNREKHINLLLQNLQENFSGHHHKIQIVVSDNSDVPTGFTAIAPNVQIVRPESFLATAEENLFFALSKCNGEFVWPIGDDDIPQRQGIAALLLFLNKPKGDWAVFNHGVIDYTGTLKSLKLLNCSKPSANFLYSDFVSIAGYQTTAACISLTVFRRNLVTTKHTEIVRQFSSPIYSHVALYLLSFGDRQGLFIDTPLVNYRNNRQATSPRDDNWVKWSKRNKTPYRHPWTVGLIEQFNYLLDTRTIKPDFPIVFLETDHFGNKFSGLQQMIFYVIDQIRLDEKLGAKNKFSPNDRMIIANFLSRFAPQHAYLIEALQNMLSEKSSASNAKFAKHKFLATAYLNTISRFLYTHAVVSVNQKGIIYRVPKGYMYLPHGNNSYIDLMRFVDAFETNKVNFSKDYELLKRESVSSKDFGKVKPTEIYSFSNFEGDGKLRRFDATLKLAKKIIKKLSRS